MQSIFDWLSSVLALLLCASVIDMLITDSPMRKYVRLTAGLVIMAALIKPLFSPDWSPVFEQDQDLNAFQVVTDQHIDQLSDLSELDSATYMDPQLQSDATAAASAFPACEVMDVQSEAAADQLTHVRILVRGQCPESSIQQTLSEKWNIEPHQVNMVMEKEEKGGG